MAVTLRSCVVGYVPLTAIQYLYLLPLFAEVFLVPTFRDVPVASHIWGIWSRQDCTPACATNDEQASMNS